MGQEGAIVAQVLACQYNNQCRLLLSDGAEGSPRDSKQEERHADEVSTFASGHMLQLISSTDLDRILSQTRSIVSSHYHLFSKLKKTPGWDVLPKRREAERRGFKLLSWHDGRVI